MHLRTHRAPTGFVIVGLLVVLVAGAALGQNAAQAAQTDTSGGITVKAVLVTPAYFKTAPTDPLAGKVDLDRNIVVAVTLDTHAGDLGRYDFVKNTLLRNDRRQQVAPLQWVATADGSHHRAGGLVFPKADQAGRDRRAGENA